MGLCRICAAAVDKRHATAIFSRQGHTHNWPCRLSELLEVPVNEHDGFPGYMCRTCKRTVESVEGKLRSLKEQICESYSSFSAENRRRSKSTSSLEGVSPATAAARPPAKKRTSLQKRQLFPAASEDSSGIHDMYIDKCIDTREEQCCYKYYYS